MTRVALHQADMVTALMTDAVAVEVMVAMIRTVTVDLVAMIVVIVAMADVTVTTTLLVVSIVMQAAMTATAVVETTDVAAVADTLTAMTEVVIATVDGHPEMPLQLPPMATQLLAESLGSHTEVETTMRDTPVVAIDC
jgi:hypothetical protein